MTAPGLMICGTASDVGKSRIVAGLCRLLARRGLKVAPFKAQNMALNSFVTATGGEISRSQAHQAAAARVVPEVAMNPVLLKPTGEMTSQLIVMGRPVGQVRAGEYGRRSETLFETVLAALEDLRSRHDCVIAEGAGGAAEINLLEKDIVNLPLAARAKLPAVLVGDTERGGVFASIYGTQALLPPELARCLEAFIINKFRGEPAILQPGVTDLERRTGLAALGVLPHLGQLTVDAEDSLALAERPATAGFSEGDLLDIAVICLPRLANFTDFDPLALEPAVQLRYVAHPADLQGADLVVLPGSKATVSDLAWLREGGFDRAIRAALEQGAGLLGICAGYQMLGRVIRDEVESEAGEVPALGLLDVSTHFSSEKTTRQVRGRDQAGNEVFGYEIHHGTVSAGSSVSSWFELEREGGRQPEGASVGAVHATSLHGLFESDRFRVHFLEQLAHERNKSFVASPISFAARREEEIERVTDAIEAHLDVDRLMALLHLS